jgi:hypothetical protein
MAARVETGVRVALLAALALPRVIDAEPDVRDEVTGRPTAPPAIVVTPAVTAPRRPIHVVVHGLAPGGNVSLELAGATSRQARPLPPLPLHFVGGAWRGTMRAPALVGAYPVRLERGGRLLPLDAAVCVFSSAAYRQHGFATATDAARSWVSRLPRRSVLVALRAWPQTALDRRDRRLNTVLVIAYAPAYDQRLSDRLGIFLTLARERVGARWRLVQATVVPYGR